MIINGWADKWGIPRQAVAELCELLNVTTQPQGIPGKSEASNQQQVRLDHCKQCGVLWRNNNGVLLNQDGVPVRYGLANDSKKVNQQIKSSDLIGVTPYTITIADVGNKVGIFTAIEMKRGGWKFTGTSEQLAQLRYLQLILSLGGIAKFSTGD